MTFGALRVMNSLGPVMLCFSSFMLFQVVPYSNTFSFVADRERWFDFVPFSFEHRLV